MSDKFKIEYDQDFRGEILHDSMTIIAASYDEAVRRAASMAFNDPHIFLWKVIPLEKVEVPDDEI